MDNTVANTPGTDLWPLWHNAVRTPVIDTALRQLYQQLDQAVQSRGPTCWVSGRCCNFDAYGHRLYVTGLEIAWVVAQATGDDPSDQPPTSQGLQLLQTQVSTHGPCPFQVNNLCGVHAIRPMGCRVFFCQAGTDQWQHEVYEDFLSRLRALHDHHTLPYRYLEWRAGLHEAPRVTTPSTP